jgi:Tfp pilus assembly protein FimT
MGLLWSRAGIDYLAVVWEDWMMPVTTVSNNQQQDAIAQALVALPQVIFNSFFNGFSGTEITSILSFGPRALITLSMAPSVAKSFGAALLETVDQYEKSTGVSVPTLQELQERMSAQQEGG